MPRIFKVFNTFMPMFAGAFFFFCLLILHELIFGFPFPVKIQAAFLSSGAVFGLILLLLYRHDQRKYSLKIASEEQKRLLTYFNLAGNIIVMIGRDQMVKMINKRGLEILGFSEEELYRENWYDLTVPEENREIRKRQHEKIFSADEKEVIDVIKFQPYRREILTKYGRRTIVWNSIINRDKEGNIISIIASGQDITRFNKAEEVIKKLEEFPSKDPNPILRIGFDGDFQYSNQAGLPLIAKWLNEATPERAASWIRVIQRIIESESYNEREIKLGDELYTLTIIPVKEYQHVNIYARDITERHRISEELQKSEARFRRVLDLVPHMICAKDWDGYFVLANENIASSYGLAPEELIGKRQIDIHTNKEDAERRRQSDRKVIESGKPVFLPDDWYLSPNGELRYIETTKLPFEYDSKTLALTLGIDVTERKKAEEELREARNRAENYLDIVEVMLAAIDADGNITLINKKGAATLGYKQEELVGKNWFDLMVLEGNREEVRGVFKKLMAGEVKVVDFYENPLLRKNGEERFFAFHNSVTKDASGQITGILFSAEDITDRKQMESRLIQTEKMQAIGQLAGGIAHDFNNQLAGIIGYTDILYSKLEDAKHKHYAKQILTSSRRAADLTAQLLAFSRKGKYLSVVVNLNELIGEVISLLEHGIDERIEIKKNLTLNPAVTTGDPTQLQNVILNMAINARDAMPQGGELSFDTEIIELDEYQSKLHAYGVVPGSYVCISIKDTGEGMDKETCKHIFEPFFTTKEAGQGVGMGLAAAYGVIKNHKGVINVYSELNRGTVFKIYLPLSESQESNSNFTPEVIIKAETSATIMVVDDEETVREAIADILESIGYETITCQDGEEALDYYQANWKSIDLVILDIIMPKMGGCETLIAMRQVNPDLQAILCSGYSIDSKTRLILDKDHSNFIQKPFTASTLSQNVARLLETASN